jgi:predicted nucleotidyltransferase
VKRSEARRRIQGLIDRVVSGEGRYLPRVREVWIFGSYARGALEVGDVDLAVEFDQTKDEAGRWFATLMAGGVDHLGALRRELRGNQRALEIHFNELDDLRKEGFEPRLLWRRGDSPEEAHARLAALAPDASAQRAARDTVHPLLADVEKLIPPGPPGVLALHVGGLARRQARRATAAAGRERRDPPPLRRAVV